MKWKGRGVERLCCLCVYVCAVCMCVRVCMCACVYRLYVCMYVCKVCCVYDDLSIYLTKRTFSRFLSLLFLFYISS